MSFFILALFTNKTIIAKSLQTGNNIVEQNETDLKKGFDEKGQNLY